MKNRHIIPSVALVLLALTATTGCSDDVKYDVDGTNDNCVYIAPRNVDNPFECEVMTTPAGIFGRVAADLGIKTQYPTSDSVRVSAKVNADATLVEQYNTAHATAYRLPSADILQAIKITPSGVGAGKNQSSVPVTVALDDKKIESFRATGSEDPDYLIPVSLLLEGHDGKGSDRPYGLSERYNTAYIIIKTSKADYLTSVIGENVIASNIIKTPAGYVHPRQQSHSRVQQQPRHGFLSAARQRTRRTHHHTGRHPRRRDRKPRGHPRQRSRQRGTTTRRSLPLAPPSEDHLRQRREGR